MDEILKTLHLELHEKTFNVFPVGIKYECTHCHVGQMIASDSDPFEFKNGMPISRIHYCDNCGARMSLPKTYPYVEWVPIQGTIGIEEKKNETT